MPDIQADQQGCDLLHDARVLQFAAVDGANARNLRGQGANDLSGIRIIAADNHIAVDGAIGIQQFGSNVVKCGHNRNAFRHKFGGLLRRGALPDAESAAWRGRQRSRLAARWYRSRCCQDESLA